MPPRPSAIMRQFSGQGLQKGEKVLFLFLFCRLQLPCLKSRPPSPAQPLPRRHVVSHPAIYPPTLCHCAAAAMPRVSKKSKAALKRRKLDAGVKAHRRFEFDAMPTSAVDHWRRTMLCPAATGYWRPLQSCAEAAASVFESTQDVMPLASLLSHTLSRCPVDASIADWVTRSVKKDVARERRDAWGSLTAPITPTRELLERAWAKLHDDDQPDVFGENSSTSNPPHPCPSLPCLLLPAVARPMSCCMLTASPPTEQMFLALLRDANSTPRHANSSSRHVPFVVHQQNTREGRRRGPAAGRWRGGEAALCHRGTWGDQPGQRADHHPH